MPGCSFNAGTYRAAALWLEESKVEYGPNPKRENTKSYDRYEGYKKAATIGEALEFGSLPDDLLFDYEKGHLKVSDPLRSAPLDLFSVKDFDQLTFTDKTLAKYAAAGAAAGASADGGQNPDQKLFVTKLDESLRKHRANKRRLVKIEKAKTLDVDVDQLADDTGAYENETMAARRSIANQQAEDILAVIESEGRRVSDFEVLSTLRLWDFRENTARQNVMKEGESFVYSDTVGLVANYVGGVVVKEECRRYPNFGKLLNRWLRDNLPQDLGAEFVYTSININKNYAGKLHRDGNNLGPSFLKSFGDFTGGELNYYPEDDKTCTLDVIQAKHADKSVQVDVSKGLLLFDGKRGHFVNEFAGERYSLVFFTCPRFDRISEDGRSYMNAAGFPFPNQDSTDKLATVLRRPQGYEGSGGAAASKDQHCTIHDQPFLFHPHASPERDENEARAEQYWKTKGLRNRLECKPEDKVESRKKHNDPTRWYGGLNFVLPAEPTRKDLILEGQNNMVDAVIFLNKEDSKVPNVILEAGCCAVFAKKFKKWHVLFRFGLKSQAMELFGVQSTDSKEGDEEEKENRTPPHKQLVLESGRVTKEENETEKETGSETGKGKGKRKGKGKGKKRKAEDEIEEEKESQTPPQKKKAVEPHTTEKKVSSDEKTINPKAGPSSLSNFFRKKVPTCSSTSSMELRTEPAAPELATVDESIMIDPTNLKEGDVIEVTQPVRALNSSSSVANLLLGQRGRLVQIDAAGDALIHVFEHKDVLQWVSKADMSKLCLLPMPPKVPKPGV